MGCCGRGVSLLAAAINQEVAVVTVVLYQAMCPDSRLASLSAPAPRTWLSTLPDPPDNMHCEQTEKEGSFSSKPGEEGELSPLLVMPAISDLVISKSPLILSLSEKQSISLSEGGQLHNQK